MAYNSNPTLDRILFALLGDLNLVEKWWSSPNLAFDNKTPAEVYMNDKNSVEDYVLQFFDR